MTDKLLKSESFKERNEKFLRAITGDYDQKLVFSGQDKNKKEKIEVNPINPIFEEKELVERIMGVRGVISQRSFHRLFTDYSALKKLEGAKNQGSTKQIAAKDFLEMVEDVAVEQAGCYEFPGLRPYVDMVNDAVHEKMPSVNMVAATQGRLKAFKIAAWEYLNKGKTKEIIQDEKLNELFEQAKPLLEQATTQKTTHDRVKLSNKLTKLVKDLIEEAVEQGQDSSMDNPKGEDMSEENEGEGQETPEEAMKKEKPKKSESSKEKSDKKGDSGDKSDEKGDSGDKSDEKGDSGDKSDEKGDSGDKSDEKGDSGDKSDEKGDSGDKSGDQGDSGDKSGDQDGSGDKSDEKGDSGDSGDGQSGEGNGEESKQTPEKGEGNGKQDNSPRDVNNEGGDAEGEKQKQLDEIMQELEKEIQEMNEEIKSGGSDVGKGEGTTEEKEKKVADELKTDVDYGNLHKDIKIKSDYNFNPNKSLYSRLQSKTRPYARSLGRRIQNLIKYNMEEKRMGESVGYLTQSELWRKDGRIFSHRKDKNDEADLVIAVLVDESGSMGHYSRSTWAREAAVVMAEVCEQLNIPLAVLGHTATFHQKTVQLRHYIGFEKSIAEQKANLSEITARQDNRDGLAIQYAGEYLMKQPQKDKLLIVIADGEPAHGVDRYHGSGAVKDCQNVVDQLSKKGVTSVGVAIGEGQDQIESMFPNFVSIPQLEKLPIKLVKVLEKNIFKK